MSIREDAAIRAALDVLGARDPDIAATVARIGYPPPRVRAEGFATVLRIIVGQQLSVKAAATIWGRLETLLGTVAPAELSAASDEALRAVGLSRSKVTYSRALADADIDFDALRDLPDDAVVSTLTAVKGLGVWSAHMYLMFALGRPDVWPSGDLAVRVSSGIIKGLPERPTARQSEQIAEAWRPHRSAAALLCWHVAHNPPA